MLGFKRSHESGSGGPERKIQKGSKHRVPKRALSSTYKTYSNLPKFRKKSGRKETVTLTTSDYHLIPRSGKKSRIPTKNTEDDTTRRTSSIQKKQRKVQQPLHRRANKIKQQECQTRR
ncbi:hypothetical protein TNCV_2201151 [Trichonephila clavipes]|uniref:Uncharacterized protein n=1 Tax=Trichonephila clavipes TaxID=2585209 RepID=A0A8X6SL12_TRICX|nr:hypothetical protein TNCV_2201151 [Trichonephila clavipes]